MSVFLRDKEGISTIFFLSEMELIIFILLAEMADHRKAKY